MTLNKHYCKTQTVDIALNKVCADFKQLCFVVTAWCADNTKIPL